MFLEKLIRTIIQNLLTLATQFILPVAVLCLFNFEVFPASFSCSWQPISVLTRFRPNGARSQVILTIRKATEQRRELVSSERREHNTAKMMIYVVLGEWCG